MADALHARTLREVLLADGVTPEELHKAVVDGTVLLLAVERMVFDAPHYSTEQMLERSPLPPERTTELWRSLGFPDPPAGKPFFTDADIEILDVLAAMIENGESDPELLVGMTRVAGQSMARFAAAQIDLFVEQAEELAGEMTDDELLDRPDAAQLVTATLPTIPRLMEYVWRRHMQAASRNRLTRNDWTASGESLAVGFADLVGFTALSQQMSSHDLAELIGRFEHLAYDIVAGLGGRVVKMIGDEVMFSVDDPLRAAEIALTLSEAYSEDEQLGDVRVGLSWGPVLQREGDCFGPVVNLASRVVNIAYPGSVVVSDELHELLEDDPELAWRSLRRKSLKDIGRVTLWTVRRADDDTPEESRRDRARRERSERADREIDRLAERIPAAREHRRRREVDKVD